MFAKRDKFSCRTLSSDSSQDSAVNMLRHNLLTFVFFLYKNVLFWTYGGQFKANVTETIYVITWK